MTFQLETKRLIIRPFTLDDAEDFHRTLGDPDVMGRIPGGTSPSVERTKQWIERGQRYQAEWGFSLWALVSKEQDEIDCGKMEKGEIEVKIGKDEAALYMNPRRIKM